MEAVDEIDALVFVPREALGRRQTELLCFVVRDGNSACVDVDRLPGSEGNRIVAILVGGMLVTYVNWYVPLESCCIRDI